jgi:dephospho-CoA kinase
MEAENNNKSIVVGITGGFGSGKSTVAAIIEAKGFKVLILDDIAKNLMVSDESLKTRISAEFGNESYNPDGSLNRQFLAKNVFAGTDDSRKKLDLLNSIVHPAVIDEMIRKVDELEISGEKLVFVESALIFETGLEDGFDYVVTVFAPNDKILERAAAKGYNESQAMERISEQLSVEEKLKLSDFSINNDSSIEKLNQSVDFIMGILVSLTT